MLPVRPLAFALVTAALGWAALADDGSKDSARDVWTLAAPVPESALTVPLVVDGRATDALMGALLFRSPEILGDEARALRVSCQTCHPNGGRNASLVVLGASKRPGQVDLTSGRFGTRDDGVENALVVPTLRDVGARPLPFVERPTTDLARGIHDHIVLDFGGAPLDVRDLDALARFVRAFSPSPHALVDVRGRIATTAPALVKKGEAIFTRAQPAFAGKSCASCHVRESAFQDGRTWPHGPPQRVHVRTPSLFDLSERGPFFVDGRAHTLDDVLLEYGARHGVVLSAPDKDALFAYLAAVGGEPVPVEPTVRATLEEGARFLRLLDGSDPRPSTCARVLARLDEALGAHVPPIRIAFKVEGARARAAQFARTCEGSATRPTSKTDAERLFDDVLRLAAEWEAARATPPDGVR